MATAAICVESLPVEGDGYPIVTRWRDTCLAGVSMRNPDVESVGCGLEPDLAWRAKLERDERNVALVIAEPSMAEVIANIYRVYGYDVRVTRTPLEVVQVLESARERIETVLISPDAHWGQGFHEFIEDEYPEVGRVQLAA